MTKAFVAVLLLVTASVTPAYGQAGTQAPGAFFPPRILGTNQIQGFNIVLVLGVTQPAGTAPTEELPAGAKTALNDMREFLPFKHYRVLDSQWISCCHANTTVLSGRLRGVIGVPSGEGTTKIMHRVFGFTVSASASEIVLPVRFVLTPHTGPQSDEQEASRAQLIARLEQSISELEAQQKAQRERGYTEKHPQMLELVQQQQLLRAQMTQLNIRGQATEHAASEPLIDSSFTMNVGETVVVGTSRVGGDKALIALITAARKGSR